MKPGSLGTDDRAAVEAGPLLRAGQWALYLQADHAMAQVITALRTGTAASASAASGADLAAHQLAELHGALALTGEQGLAALVARLRGRVLLAHGPQAREASDLPALALRLRADIRRGLEHTLRGQPLQAADWLSAWQALDTPDEIADPAPLISLQADEQFGLALPIEAGQASYDPLPDAERALLGFLRAAGATERCEAAACLARVLAGVAAAESHAPTRRLWLVLRAYVDELAADQSSDPVRTKHMLALLLRALRHRADPSLPLVLEPLARQGLFELAQTPALAETARQALRAFRMEQQLSVTVSGDAPGEPALAEPADEDFMVQLGEWIAAREAANDGLGSIEAWYPLAEAARQSGRFAILAAPLHRLGEQWSQLQETAAGQCVAAAMLCLHGWAIDSPAADRETVRIAGLLDRVIDDAAAVRTALPTMVRRLEGRSLMQSLVAACSEVLGACEQLLDNSPGQHDLTQAAGDARRLLGAVAGAARLLALQPVSARVEPLLDPLDDLCSGATGDDGCLQALAQGWVVLADELAMLPWTAEWADEWADEPAVVPPAPGAEARATDPSELSSPVAAASIVDDPLVAIFLDEAAGLLARLRSALLPADTQGSVVASAEARYAAHTLAGCSVTVGLPAMGALAQALESLLERAASSSLSPADPALIPEVLDTLDAMLMEFAQSGTCEDADLLLARLAAHGSTAATGHEPGPAHAAWSPGCGGLPPDEPDDGRVDGRLAPVASLSAVEDAGAPDATAGIAADDDIVGAAFPGDDELLAIFREEAADLLPRLEQALHQWSESPDDRAASTPLLHILHTLKGSARMAGQLAWGEALHRCETEVGTIAQLPAAALRERLTVLEEQIDDWRRAWCASPVRLFDEAVPDAAGPGDAADRATFPVASSAAGAAALAGQPPEPVPATTRASSSSLLRVRPEKFTAFAEAVAELWVGHARLADGVQQQRRSVTELADNLARLRAQVRELEIDAESRIVSGSVSADDKGFDPLEFDRYTRLHEITRMIAECAADLVDLQRGLMRQGDGLSRAVDAQARDLRGLQSSLQAVRSQPFGTIEGRLRHLLRQAAREAGREVDCVFAGASVEVDRALLDRLAGPLEHVLRNAVVHGIEPPAERTARGKPRSGRITLSVHVSAAELRLELADDGRGLDLERIRDRAAAIGLLTAQTDQDAQALSDLIFQPGFSTASEVTALAGRGIGLDAVRTELQALGGQISVASRAGQGCRFTIVVPLSLATLPVLLVRAGRYCIGLLAHRLQQVLQLKPGDPGHDMNSRTLQWQGADIPLADLGHLLGEPPQPVPVGGRVPVAVLRESDRLLALRLDTVDGQRELVVKHPGQQLARVPGLAGASVLGDGRIALIIDPFRLHHRDDPLPLAPFIAETRPVVMVVDDSLTVRRASQRLLERQGYEVVLARDGLEALDLLRERRPAVVLLDIEMPRMDGFDLLAAVREDPRLRALPVVMITSRIAERHRQRALQLGASAYMGKPFREEELVSLLAGLCRSTSGAQNEGRVEEQSGSHRSEAAA